MFHRFNTLIEARHREHWSLAQYAAELGATPSDYRATGSRLG